MCGIMGYIGKRPAVNIISTGLKKLEYRGYDSAGIAVLSSKDLQVVKAVGDTSQLDLSRLDHSSTIGIGHTRWATHGKPSERNAHPHCVGQITLVHNGIIENLDELKAIIGGYKYKSETDSEVLAALINHYLEANIKGSNLIDAVQSALLQVKGTFGIAVLQSDNPEQIVVARRGSPIVIGVGKDQNYIASDSTAILDYTDKVIYLEDDQIAVLSRTSVELFDLKLTKQHLTTEHLENDNQQLDKGKFGSFLEKEIFEQPEAIRNVTRGRVGADGLVHLGGPRLSLSEIKHIRRIYIIGCGTAYYAGYYAKYQLESILGIPVTVEHASEFRYRYSALDPSTTLAIFMSQSGETADTLSSLREAKRRGMKTMGIVNSVGSTIAREVANGGIYLHAGVESSVASTKAYSSMVVALLMFGAFIAHRRGADPALTQAVAKELRALPAEIEHVLGLHDQIEKIGSKLAGYKNWFYLGRGQLFPVALEGALKLTEVAYIHAQAFPAGEMKHGPIALIDSSHLSVLLLPEDEFMYNKSLATLEEIKARGGNVFTLSTRPKEKLSDYHITIAHSGEHSDGLLYNVCLQLLCLAVATKLKKNIDRPRNLAKSVTVE